MPVSTALVGLVFFAAGAVKGVVGLGLPTFAMALLGLLMPPAHAGLLLLVPSFVTNVWQMLHGGALRRLLVRLWLTLVGICVGTWLGVAWFDAAQPRATLVLGVVLAVYGMHGLGASWTKVGQLSPRLARVLGPLAGFATGLLSAPTAVFVVPLVPYLQALGLPKNELVQALGLTLTAATLALAVGRAPEFAASLSAADLILPTLAALAGMGLGQKIRHRLAGDAFRRCFFAALIALGAFLALRAT